MWNRRQLLSGLGSVGVSSLVWPRVARAEGHDERKFLFIYLDGGWDTLKLTTPMFDAPLVDMDSTSELDEVNGIPYAASPNRESVTTFLENYGDKVCVVNGMEVRSIAHERCRRLLFTGEGVGGYDDWPSLIAGNSGATLAMPYVVMNGWAYNKDYPHVVVRVGSNGQLPDLLDGSAALDTVQPAVLPSSSSQDLGNQWLESRMQALAEQAPAGARQEFYEGYGRVLSDLSSLKVATDLTLETPFDGCTRDVEGTSAAIFDLMEAGLTRCGMMSFRGQCDYGWDSHSDNDFQDFHYQGLFAYLDGVMKDLATRTSPSGNPLEDELVIVICSEMGRHPIMNTANGRDHWTYTSFMLMGAGISGGQVIGAMNDDFVGKGVDLTSGEVVDGGVALEPKHFGATLLALADMDYGDYIANGGGIIEAALK